MIYPINFCLIVVLRRILMDHYSFCSFLIDLLYCTQKEAICKMCPELEGRPENIGE